MSRQSDDVCAEFPISKVNPAFVQAWARITLPIGQSGSRVSEMGPLRGCRLHRPMGFNLAEFACHHAGRRHEISCRCSRGWRRSCRQHIASTRVRSTDCSSPTFMDLAEAWQRDRTVMGRGGSAVENGSSHSASKYQVRMAHRPSASCTRWSRRRGDGGVSNQPHPWQPRIATLLRGCRLQ